MERNQKIFAARVILVTGGSRGIGFATAQAFLQQGARVAICGLDAARLATAEKALTAWGTIYAAVADVGDPVQVSDLVESTRRQLGEIDVLVNNAGRLWSGPFAEQPPDTIDEMLDSNVRGVMIMTRTVLPGMLARGSGVIVNVASGAGLTGFAGLAAYCASKFAVVGFTAALAEELRESGVRIYAVCPGSVDTDMQREYSGQRAGMAPGRVAEKILALAGPRPPVRPGRCLEIGY